MFKTKSRNEYTFKDLTSFVTKYGNPHRENIPKVIYLRMKGKVTPAERKRDYSKDITRVKRLMTEFVESEVKRNDSLFGEYLFNLDLSEKNIAYNKVSFLRYDIYLKPTTPDTLDNMCQMFEEITDKVNCRLKELLVENGISYR